MHRCCQTAGFCVTQNCTAIFVGCTLIAGALVSFMTCGICIYRCLAPSPLHGPAVPCAACAVCSVLL